MTDAHPEPSPAEPAEAAAPAPTAAAPTAAAPTAAAPTVSDPTAAAEKDPDDWVTGDEPMTGPQASYLSTLAQDTGREVPDSLSKADASKLIDELRSQSNRT